MTLTLDLPRISIDGIRESDIREIEVAQPWSIPTMRAIYAAVRPMRRGKVEVPACNYFLDLPWQLLGRNHMLGADGPLIKSLRESAPKDFAYEKACSIAPAESLRLICVGAPEWALMRIGVLDRGEFSGLVECPVGYQSTHLRF
jgi:hypothetical protein